MSARHQAARAPSNPGAMRSSDPAHETVVVASSQQKRTRSTQAVETTPNKHARVAATPSALEGVRRLERALPRKLSITSPCTRSQVSAVLRASRSSQCANVGCRDGLSDMLMCFRLPQSRQRKADEGQAAVFKWSDAFAQLQSREEGLFLHILGYLCPHPLELRNFAETCKPWNRIVRAQPALSQSLSVPASIMSLHALQDTCARASLLTSHLLETKRVLFKSHRKILFDWLVDVQGEYQLSTETLHTAFTLIDRCLQLKPNLPTGQVQLLGATCMFIASKYCCEGTTHPSLPDMIWVCDNAFSRQEHSRMEIDILMWTEFKVRAETPISFIEGLCPVLNLAPESKRMACYLTDLFLLDADSIGMPPACIASASILVALHTIDEFTEETLSQISYLARVPAQQMRSAACKMQQLQCTDYLINGPGRDLPWLPRAELSETALRAAFERHSIAPPPGALGLQDTPAALKRPKLPSIESSLTAARPCCSWCKDCRCAEALVAKFPSTLFSRYPARLL